jgi:hypothetical protein
MDRTWLLALLIGCVPPQPQPSYYGQQQPQGTQAQYAQQGQGPASGMTCMGLFQCFQACRDGTCIQGCLGQADPATQAAASAYMQCGADRCKDQDLGGDCLNINCQTELDTCRGTATVAYNPPQQQQVPQQQASEQLVYPDQPHTTANLLPWMTGQWIGTNNQFEFWADGRVRRSSGVPLYSQRTGSYQCVSVVNEIGTVRQEGDMLIMDFAPADSNHCGAKDQAAQGLTVRYKITWYKYSDLPTNLLLVDIDCTRGAMYCNDQLRRR